LILVLLDYSGIWSAVLLASAAILSNFTAIQRIIKAIK